MSTRVLPMSRISVQSGAQATALDCAIHYAMPRGRCRGKLVFLARTASPQPIGPASPTCAGVIAFADSNYSVPLPAPTSSEAGATWTFSLNSTMGSAGRASTPTSASKRGSKRSSATGRFDHARSRYESVRPSRHGPRPHHRVWRVIHARFCGTHSAADKVTTFVRGKTVDEFTRDELLYSDVERKLEIVGEPLKPDGEGYARHGRTDRGLAEDRRSPEHPDSRVREREARPHLANGDPAGSRRQIRCQRKAVLPRADPHSR